MVDRKTRLRLALLALLSAIVVYTFHSGKSGAGRRDADDYSNLESRKDRTGFRQASELNTQHPVIDWVDHTSDFKPKHPDSWRIVYSQSTKDKKYFHVNFAGVEAFNVNIIPHPAHKRKWIVVAQSLEYREDVGSSEQLVCIAEFVDGVLHCSKSPTALPIASSINGQCNEEWSFANMRRGPRDARAFYGPDQPYLMYGSLSQFTCLGLWLQNLWMLLDGAKHPDEGFARGLTELQRPQPAGQIQKNWFLFWDNSSKVYAHYDIHPQRVYSWLAYDGSAVPGILQTTGLNIGQFAIEHDQTCMDKLFPKLDAAKKQQFHQGTNSLWITMCKRSDADCVETDENTFVLHIMQRKTYIDLHGDYEPFPVLFRRTVPFELYAIAQKPLFYHGIGLLSEKTESNNYKIHPEFEMPTDSLVQTYTTSISWKENKQTYHGYLDDVLFIGFGIEDTRSGAIDVLASDILQDLAFC